jgi:polyvinyl alcohol dehydrogenase (cytochrome)
VTVIPGAVLSGSMDGHLRAYSTKDGSIVWDFDTGVAFETVNGVKAKGGSLDAAGPTVSNGMLYVNSGYGRIAGRGGNVLLAFSLDGK